MQHMHWLSWSCRATWGRSSMSEAVAGAALLLVAGCRARTKHKAACSESFRPTAEQQLPLTRHVSRDAAPWSALARGDPSMGQELGTCCPAASCWLTCVALPSCRS